MGRRVPLRALIPRLAPIAIALVAIGGFEVAMQPTPEQRLALVVIFVGLSLLTLVAAWALPRVSARFDLLEHTLEAVAIGAVLMTAIAVGLSAVFMFLAGRELRLLLILLGFGVGLGIALAMTIARQLSADVSRVGLTAQRVAHGDLQARTGVERRDEVGRAAEAVDAMARQLESMEGERERTAAARQAFLTAIGHDLRTPLTALGAALEALEDRLEADPSRYLGAMRRDLEAMRGLVDDLFLLARIESGTLHFERVPLDLAELVDEAVEALWPVARKRGVRIRLENGQGVAASGGPAELSRALRNLLDNAIRHAPPDTEVVVHVVGDGEATVRVIDQGAGFSDELRESVFRGVIRAEGGGRAAGGAGLGLAIAKGLVEAHGGRIWIEPGPGGRVGLAVPSR